MIRQIRTQRSFERNRRLRLAKEIQWEKEMWLRIKKRIEETYGGRLK